jgi:hypothetical protein
MRTLTRLLHAGALALLGACAGGEVHVPGTTVRVDPPVSESGGNQELQLYMFHDAQECAALVKAEDVSRCLPWMDRSTGQVRVAFQMRVGGTPWPVPLDEDGLEVYHKNQRVTREGLKKFQLIPHEPRRAEQMFVLMIDATYSMGLVDPGETKTRLEKVRDALLRRGVVSAFFPEGVRTSVVPLLFTGGKLPTPLAPGWVIEDAQTYRRVIRDSLNLVPAGYTPLYDAMDYSITTVLEQPEVKSAVQVKNQQPTVVILTDGFNNPLASDTCADNAPRLEKLLAKVDTARRGQGVDVRRRPTVYTVGLGRKAWRGGEDLPDGIQVTPRTLCRGKANQPIDGGLERYGVDNITLSWLARTGGGKAFVSRTTEGLADAFAAAAALRYDWFEARYQVDPFFLRRAFDAKLRLTALNGVSATMRFRPSGWLDAPPGNADADGWTQPDRFARTATLLFPALGLIAALGYLPAAWFNVRRAIGGRVGKRRK